MCVIFIINISQVFVTAELSSRPFAFLYIFQAKLGYSICTVIETLTTLITFTIVLGAVDSVQIC